ncbi:MAG: CARDB domain-containing protein [Chloroflexota bacterium]
MKTVLRWLSAFAIGVVLAAGCAQASPTPTQIPTVTPTPRPTQTPTPTLTPTPIPSPTPTSTATPVPTAAPSPTPIATLQPTPTREATVNIAPFTPRNWVLPLVASGRPGPYQAAELSVDGETYISWAVINNSRNSIDYTFYVDVYLDDVLAERWKGNGVGANQFISITDWEGLPTRVRLQPGTHMLKLVVDPTNLVPETDEVDNIYELEFTWAPSTTEPPVVAPAPTKLPDLVPSIPNGWGDSLIATSYPGDKADGPLSVNVPTYIRYGFRNQGLASIEGDIWAYLYLDDVLVSAQAGGGLLAEEAAGSSEWAELFDVINVTPGVHTLRLEVDPTNLIIEADEQNNTVERRFTWGIGGVPPKPAATPLPMPTAPAPLTLPNLVPGWRLGWDGPIIVSHQEETFLDSLLTVDRTPFIDVVVHNESIVETPASFSVDLYFDDEIVHTFDFPEGMEPNQLLWFADWDGLANRTQITEGPHTLKMVIDPDNAVEEADEGDNVYQETLVWVAGTVDMPEPIVYSSQELQQKLANLQVIIDTREPALSPEGHDHTREVLEVADAGYYLLTGKSLLDERVDIYLLTHRDYLAWIDDSYAERFALNEQSEYAELLAKREKTKTTALGLKGSRFGKVAVVVDAERGLADVIGCLAHELGHMRQGFLNSAQDDGATASYYRHAIQEAQAQQFERAFWLELEAFTGLTLLEYPDYQGFRNLIETRFNSWFADPSQDEHLLGYLLQWLAVLDDPNLVDLKQEMTAQRQLGAEASLELYNYLVGLAPESIQAYVTSRIQSLDTYAETIKGMAMSRLVSGLHPDSEGSPDLRETGLLVP